MPPSGFNLIVKYPICHYPVINISCLQASATVPASTIDVCCQLYQLQGRLCFQPRVKVSKCSIVCQHVNYHYKRMLLPGASGPKGQHVWPGPRGPRPQNSSFYSVTLVRALFREGSSALTIQGPTCGGRIFKGNQLMRGQE